MISQTVRAHVITPVLTYRGHQLDIDEAARIAYVIDRDTGESILELREAEWSMPNRDSWRVEGVLGPAEQMRATAVALGVDDGRIPGDGVAQVWKAQQACGRCGRSVFPTPEYDLPT